MLHGSFQPALEFGRRLQESRQLCAENTMLGLGEAVDTEEE